MIYISNGRKLTLKRGSAEWFNEDCPPIEAESGNRIFSSFISETHVDENLRLPIYRFIRASHKLFCKKYGYEMSTLSWLERDVRPKNIGVHTRKNGKDYMYAHNPESGFNEIINGSGVFTGVSPY